MDADQNPILVFLFDSSLRNEDLGVDTSNILCGDLYRVFLQGVLVNARLQIVPRNTVADLLRFIQIALDLE